MASIPPYALVKTVTNYLNPKKGIYTFFGKLQGYIR